MIRAKLCTGQFWHSACSVAHTVPAITANGLLPMLYTCTVCPLLALFCLVLALRPLPLPWYLNAASRDPATRATVLRLPWLVAWLGLACGLLPVDQRVALRLLAPLDPVHNRRQDQLFLAPKSPCF
jgi:hypothetical protein